MRAGPPLQARSSSCSSANRGGCWCCYRRELLLAVAVVDPGRQRLPPPTKRLGRETALVEERPEPLEVLGRRPHRLCANKLHRVHDPRFRRRPNLLAARLADVHADHSNWRQDRRHRHAVASSEDVAPRANTKTGHQLRGRREAAASYRRTRREAERTARPAADRVRGRRPAASFHARAYAAVAVGLRARRSTPRNRSRRPRLVRAATSASLNTRDTTASGYAETLMGARIAREAEASTGREAVHLPELDEHAQALGHTRSAVLGVGGASRARPGEGDSSGARLFAPSQSSLRAMI